MEKQAINEKKKSKKYTFRNYIEYIRDNPKGYWFKRKLYGWGWTPAKWQGWLVLVIFFFFVIVDSLLLVSKGEPTSADFTVFLSILVVSILLLLWVCYKTGQKPKWSWGAADEEKA